MPNTWRYMDVYEVIIRYITNHLDPTNYGLNFGIITLHEQSWTQLIAGETLKELFDNVYEVVEVNKLEVWKKYLIK